MARKARPKTGAGELELIQRLSRLLTQGAPQVELGIGDDAALLRFRGGRLVVTVDEQVAGVHFDLRWLTPQDVGYRALAAAASDLAAMAAQPLAAVASWLVPPGTPQTVLDGIARGQAQAARQLGCPVVGGNIARAPVLAIATTVLGSAQRPLLRAGARAGDELWLLGDVGLARAGLLLHQQKPRLPRALGKVATRAKRAWARPLARIEDGRGLVRRARAAIDVSDGLAGDAGQLARSSGVRVVLEASLIERVLAPDLAELADLLGEPGVGLALRGGEDYALLATGPKARRPERAKVIGRIERGRGSVLELSDGRRYALGRGFDHLRG